MFFSPLFLESEASNLQNIRIKLVNSVRLYLHSLFTTKWISGLDSTLHMVNEVAFKYISNKLNNKSIGYMIRSRKFRFM